MLVRSKRIGIEWSLSRAGPGVVCEGAIGPAPVSYQTAKTLSLALYPMVHIKD